LTSAVDGGKWSALRPRRFIPGERALGIHWTERWMGPKAGLGAVEKNLLPLPGIEPQSPSPYAIVTHAELSRLHRVNGIIKLYFLYT
jgi:hypothetical protein